MTIRKIAQIGHPILREQAKSVPAAEISSSGIQRLIDDLIETMRDANGAGIAAPQVHESLRICVLEVKNNPRYPYKPEIPLTVLINPEIEFLTDETFENYEGCLSVPNLRGIVHRIARIRVRALDRQGCMVDEIASGFTAGTYQHEVDHLDGRLFLDRVRDPVTLTTWTEFERFHREPFLAKAAEIRTRYR